MQALNWWEKGSLKRRWTFMTVNLCSVHIRMSVHIIFSTCDLCALPSLLPFKHSVLHLTVMTGHIFEWKNPNVPAFYQHLNVSSLWAELPAPASTRKNKPRKGYFYSLLCASVKLFYRHLEERRFIWSTISLYPSLRVLQLFILPVCFFLIYSCYSFILKRQNWKVHSLCTPFHRIPHSPQCNVSTISQKCTDTHTLAPPLF